MDIVITAALAVTFAALAAFCGWRGSIPAAPHRGPRMAPWRFLMIACAAVVLMLFVHLINLLGVTTGH